MWDPSNKTNVLGHFLLFALGYCRGFPDEILWYEVREFGKGEQKRGLAPLPNLADASLLQSHFLNFVKPIARLWLPTIKLNALPASLLLTTTTQYSFNSIFHIFFCPKYYYFSTKKSCCFLLVDRCDKTRLLTRAAVVMNLFEYLICARVRYTPVRIVFAERKVPQPCLGGNGSTRTILCQTCAVQIMMGTVTDFRLTHREYARVIKVQSRHIK